VDWKNIGLSGTVHDFQIRTGEEVMAISKKRAALLRKLEDIVGREWFNANIQNRGPGGVLQSKGRSIRYPITFKDDAGERIKRGSEYADLSPDVQMTGRYVCGANELRILRALDKVVEYLENEHSLKI
jgi:hypothetical protein